MSAPRINTTCDFQSSDLGKKEYWDSVYSREVDCYQSIGDVGEIWFGENSQNRVIHCVEDDLAIEKTASILDIGCGNGMMLVELHKRGFTNLTGVDYSSGAIGLAESVASTKGCVDITFETGDLLLECSACKSLSRQYQVCIDKGTYDAISLMEDSEANRLKYLYTIKRILDENGTFIITSCNWTKDELVEQFSSDLNLQMEIPTPKFQFGGKVGSTVTQLIFKRKSLQ